MELIKNESIVEDKYVTISVSLIDGDTAFASRREKVSADDDMDVEYATLAKKLVESDFGTNIGEVDTGDINLSLAKTVKVGEA